MSSNSRTGMSMRTASRIGLVYGNNIYYITENAKEMTNRLNNKDSSLGLMLNDTQLYNNLNNAVGSLDSLLIDVKKNPKRYISIKLL